MVRAATGAILLFSIDLGNAAAAGPSGEQIAAGLAEFSRQGGNLTVNQLTDRAIINWQDFSIAQGHSARFVQPGDASAVLNRVVSNNPSQIYGELSANGRVFLINQNGVLVGQSGVIDTHGFVASTLDVSDAAFMAGGDLEFSGNGAGAVTNLGRIRGLDGDVFLIAPQVDNQGVVQADGTAGIAAGAQVLLREAGSQRLWVGASPVPADGDGIDTGVRNGGLVQATQAELQAAGGNVYALSINNTGVVRATTVASEGGRILLRAGNGGTVISSGTLDASSASGQGGRIEVTGARSA
jgi:filamentous hemagglutinin family protein